MVTKISKGNSKLGKVWNVSLPPVQSCKTGVPCAKGCYALKSYRLYKNTKLAWDHNFEFFNTDPFNYFQSIEDQLTKAKTKPRFFRWHVSGDIPNELYFANVVQIASQFPEINFLIFTKQYEIVNAVYKTMPERKNLQIIFSAWPGLEMDNPQSFPVAFMQDGTETRVTGAELECPGHCESCGMCWQLSKTGKNVVFNKH